MPSLEYLHVDVFSACPYGGNSLPVFYDTLPLSSDQMLTITQELRQFETVFLRPQPGSRLVSARVFDLFEELPFAGHPLVGAAAALQHVFGSSGSGQWILDLAGRHVPVTVEPRQGGYAATLDAGIAAFLGDVDAHPAVAEAFSLATSDLHPLLPLQVVSTGLRYLVVPLAPGALGRARVAPGLGALLGSVGAQFAVLLDPEALEIRHWNNDGLIEDVATGSAASVVAAYGVKHGFAPTGARFTLAQGRFVGRPSCIEVRVEEPVPGELSVQIGGPVTVLGRGCFRQPPALS